MSTQSVTIEQFIAAPPAKVWAAITEPEQVRKWWAPGAISTKVGDTFQLDMNKWGAVNCTVLESVPNEKFVYSFGSWTLNWTLEATDGGTLLRLIHAGFDLSKPQDAFAFENMGKGWKSTVLPRLAEILEQRAA